MAKNNAPLIVGEPLEATESHSNGKCPRCTKLTEGELKAVFPNVTDSKLIKEIVESFNIYCEKFNINTCTLKAHFFAQAKQESGDSLFSAIDGEILNYSIQGLLTTGFKNVSEKYMFGDKTGIKMAEELGRKSGESKLSLDKQIKIGNFVYGLNPKAKELGNKAPADNKDLSETNNEGWRYRGRGLLQITGKDNYVKIQNHVNSILGKSVLDIKLGRKYNTKFTPTEALLTGFGDWDLYKMYVPAKKGVTKEACLEIIKIINSATKSKTKRIAHLLGGTWYENDDTSQKSHNISEKDSTKSIFKVNECQGIVGDQNKCMCKKAHIDLTNKITFKPQSKGPSCNTTCRAILSGGNFETEGATANKTPLGRPSSSYYQVAEENEARNALVFYEDKMKEGLAYLDKALEEGKPVMVGVDHTFKYGTYGNINEWTTDHYILIVARYCENSQLYYQFWDVGTRTGSDKKYRFKLTEEGHLVSETTHSGKTYTVTQIRRTTKISKK